MKKFLVILALTLGAVMIAGCGKKDQDYRYEFEGSFVNGTGSAVPDVQRYLSSINMDTRENWYISAKSRSDADGEALRRFNTKVLKVDEGKFLNVEDKFRFRVTLTNVDENKVIKTVEYGKAK